MEHRYRYIDEFGSFELENAENDQGLYFPLAGVTGLKSAVTPNLGGDSKLDQNHFLMEPVSIGDLQNHRSTRNFWCLVPGKKPWSATGASAEQELSRGTEKQEHSVVRAGRMWHEIERENIEIGLHSKITSFVPLEGTTEVMLIEITNVSNHDIELTGVAAIPIYGRSADNIRDHRHVTSLLHRVYAETYGMSIRPTLSFDERGHQIGDAVYFVEGIDGNGKAPATLYPEVDAFVGPSGTLTHPEAMYKGIEQGQRNSLKQGQTNRSGQEQQTGIGQRQGEGSADFGGVSLVDTEEGSLIAAGQEVFGGLAFSPILLRAGEHTVFTVLTGAVMKDADDVANEVKPNAMLRAEETLLVPGGAESALCDTKKYWQQRVDIRMKTADAEFDQFMNWVSFQPELRKIFGCSFLPHHDYGKGGRGWRDLWQDCLALLLTDPSSVRDLLLSNFGGVRIDGTNATIIGEKQGEFKADRNSITRVWSDHGIWPLITTKFYIDQTGDYAILWKKVPYFKDRQVKRGRAIDERWNLKKDDGTMHTVYGTVFEHLLLQQLTSFYEVGEHGNLQLRDADWNDALDMANHKGETVAFTCALAMNLQHLADLLDYERKNGVETVELQREILILLRDADDEALACASDTAIAANILETYLASCKHTVSGITEAYPTDRLSAILREKANQMTERIRTTEWIDESGEGNDSKEVNNGRDTANVGGHFNSYYDDHGDPVEEPGRMMLTGQVFAIMSGTATKEQVGQIVKAADKYLYDETCGGYRLNSDFHQVRTDLGRMFGFAYGEKENGAVFSHMAVMYANALYSRGFAEAGYKALQTLYLQSADFGVSRIYPGIPEYFGKNGRGLYHYLTGAASWYLMTMVNQVFGIRGESGSLLIQPKLMREQFDPEHKASLRIPFADRRFEFCFVNEEDAGAGEYRIHRVLLNGKELGDWEYAADGGVLIRRELLQSLSTDRRHHLVFDLRRNA